VDQSKRNRRWFQFSLRLLLLVVVAANVFWWVRSVVMEEQRQKEFFRDQAAANVEIVNEYLEIARVLEELEGASPLLTTEYNMSGHALPLDIADWVNPYPFPRGSIRAPVFKQLLYNMSQMEHQNERAFAMLKHSNERCLKAERRAEELETLLQCRTIQGR